MRRPWSPVRTPAFWILLPVTALGVLVGVVLLGFGVFTAPRTAAVVIPLALLVGAGWLALLLRCADPVERRPAWLVTTAVCWGAGAAVGVAAGGNLFVDEVLGKAFAPDFAAVWSAALSAPVTEELAKAAGVVLILLVARPYVTTAWSGGMYGALVGLGFAVVEDIQYAVNAADEALPDDVFTGLGIVVLRVLVPGLVGHPLFSALAGAGIAYAWLRRDGSRMRRLRVLSVAFGGAWLMHFAVNAPIGQEAGAALQRLPGATVWVGYLAVIAAPAVPAAWWLAGLRRHDARVVLARASAHWPAHVRPDEIDVLAGLRRRAAADRQLRRGSGRAVARAARDLRRTQLRLAAALSRPHRGFPPMWPPGWLAPPVHGAWIAVDAARRALDAAAATAPTPVVAASPAHLAAAPTPVGPTAPAHVTTAAPAPVSTVVPALGATALPVVVAQPGARLRWTAYGLMVAAVLGVLWWPVAVGAVVVGATVAWRARDVVTGFAVAAAPVAAAVCGYVWLIHLTGEIFFPV